MMNAPQADGTDQLDALLDRTFTLWRATPLVYFANKTHSDMIKSLKAHLADTLNLSVNTERFFSKPEVDTIMEATLEPVQIDDWGSVDRSSRVLELTITLWYRGRARHQTYTIYFLPATLNRGGLLVDATDYPLLLVQMRNKKLATSVQQWMHREFSCHTTNFHVSCGTLSALANWWSNTLINDGAGHIRPDNKGSLELSYHITFSKDLSSLTFNISMPQLLKMQKLIQGTDLTMMDLIQEHVYKTTRIKMDYCVLAQVGTPIAYISNTGQMKLLSNGVRTRYLEFLSELCDLAGTTL